MYFFKVKQGRQKTLERKWEEKLFWNVFGWVGRKENKLCDLGIFPLGQSKSLKC